MTTGGSAAAFSTSLTRVLNQREACRELRAFLEREPMRELTAAQLETIKLLPIFLVAQPREVPQPYLSAISLDKKIDVSKRLTYHTKVDMSHKDRHITALVPQPL